MVLCTHTPLSHTAWFLCLAAPRLPSSHARQPSQVPSAVYNLEEELPGVESRWWEVRGGEQVVGGEGCHGVPT